uniref:Ataxin-10 n=1 Tax=Lepeophtheirus salmonis TaxID=72036 RepID=A0A0K2SWF9_LEPSM
MDDSLLLQLQGLSLQPQDNKEQLSLRDVSDLWTEYFLDPDISVEILRAIRKLAATLDSPDKTYLFLHHGSLFDLSEKVLVDFMDSEDPMQVLLLRITLQFLFNAFQGSNEIHRLMRFETILSNLLSRCSDAKIQDYTSSLIYIGNKSSSLFLQNELISSHLITACIEYESNFALLAIKSFVEDNLLCMYNLVKKSEDRRTLIEIIASDEELSCTSAPTISLLFKERSKRIMSANGAWSSDEAVEVTKLLDYLCDVSSNKKNLQDDKDLLIDVVHLLKMVHLLGKEDEGNKKNPFVPIRKLNDVSEAVKKEVSFGFKRDIIRLLGNLAFENEANQDLVGSLDGVQLLLDCSSIDGKNPFITQWVVFAIRNVTQGNSKNQAIIAEMERSGKLDKKLLVESGIILS